MKPALILLLTSFLALAGDRKPLPNQAGNDSLDLFGTAMITQDEIKDALGGADLGEGYVVVRIKATPRTDGSLRIGPDDFTLICRKDGERVEALLPDEIVSTSGRRLVVKSEQDRSGAGRSTVWGIGMGGGGGTGSGSQGGTKTEAHMEGTAPADGSKPDTKDSPLLTALKAKGLPDKDTKDPLEGLLYFSIDAKKVKPKDFSLLYKGPAGRLEMDFK